MSGLWLPAGGIDPHTRMEMDIFGARTVDDFFTGTRAALAGGTTTIIDSVVPSKGESLVKCLKKRKEQAKKACCDYTFHVGVTWWSNEAAKQMRQICKEEGVCSFEMDMAFKNLWMLNDSELYAAFKVCRELGAVAMVHAENGDLIAENEKKLLKMGFRGPEGHLLSRPEEVEAEAVTRACVIANQVPCPLYIRHLTSRAASSALVQKKGEGIVAFGETPAAALATDGTHYFNLCWRHAAAHVVIPPLRADPNVCSHLIEYLTKDYLSVACSDHCSFSTQQKMLGRENFTKIPYGASGVEDWMSVIWEKAVAKGKMSPSRFVAITSTNAARLFNLYPKKGVIAVGSDADIIVWNPKKNRVISAASQLQSGDFNIFEGMEVHGMPEFVIMRGKIALQNGNLTVEEGDGQFLARKPFPEYPYHILAEQEKGRELQPVIRQPECIPDPQENEKDKKQ